MCRNMDGNTHCDEVSDGNEEVTGNKRKGNPCREVSKNLADLHWRSSVLWKVELGSEETGYLAEVIPNKVLKMQAGICLLSQVHSWRGICLRTNGTLSLPYS